VIDARCSPANHLTQYWVRKPNGEQFWPPTQELKAQEKTFGLSATMMTTDTETSLVFRVLSYGRFQPGDVSPRAITVLRWIAAATALALARELVVEILRHGI